MVDTYTTYRRLSKQLFQSQFFAKMTFLYRWIDLVDAHLAVPPVFVNSQK